MLSRLVIFKELQSTKEPLGVWFYRYRLKSMGLFHLRHRVFLQFREVLTHIPSQMASFPFASPSRTWLDAAEPSQSALQAHPHVPLFRLSLYCTRGEFLRSLGQSTDSLLVFTECARSDSLGPTCSFSPLSVLPSGLLYPLLSLKSFPGTRAQSRAGGFQGTIFCHYF